MEKIRLERHAEHQRYFLSDGTQVSGASTISKMGDSPEGLIWWAWDLGIKGKDYRKARDSAADTGHISHFRAMCHLIGAEPDLREYSEDEIKASDPSFEKVLDFWDREKLTMVKVEEQLVHEELRFGGTLDVRARDEDGRNVLIDWKSAKKKVYDSMKYQVGGYELLSNRAHPDAIIQRRAIIRIPKERDDKLGVHWIPETKAVHNMRVFEAQVNLYNIMNEGKRK